MDTQTYPELQLLYILEGWNFGELDNMSACMKASSPQQRGYQLGAMCGEEVANIPLILQLSWTFRICDLSRNKGIW